ncbi:hypothetical protein LCL87_11240 [Rhodococcus hoagii]|nr:hypothetical protein [Prescottella equi]
MTGVTDASFWSNGRTATTRLLAGHAVLWAGVVIAALLPTYSVFVLGTMFVSKQILTMSVALALATVLVARSRTRAVAGVALAASALLFRTLAYFVLFEGGGLVESLDFDVSRILIWGATAVGVMLATAGWVVARGRAPASLSVLPLAVVLSVVTFRLTDSAALGATIDFASRGWVIFVVPAVVTAWAAVAAERWSAGRSASGDVPERTPAPRR